MQNILRAVHHSSIVPFVIIRHHFQLLSFNDTKKITFYENLNAFWYFLVLLGEKYETTELLTLKHEGMWISLQVFCEFHVTLFLAVLCCVHALVGKSDIQDSLCCRCGFVLLLYCTSGLNLFNSLQLNSAEQLKYRKGFQIWLPSQVCCIQLLMFALTVLAPSGWHNIWHEMPSVRKCVCVECVCVCVLFSSGCEGIKPTGRISWELVDWCARTDAQVETHTREHTFTQVFTWVLCYILFFEMFLPFNLSYVFFFSCISLFKDYL